MIMLIKFETNTKIYMEVTIYLFIAIVHFKYIYISQT